MEGKGYGFLTFERVSDAQEFLGVRAPGFGRWWEGCILVRSVGHVTGVPRCYMRACAKLAQQHEHDINGKKVEAKAAIPKDQGGSRLTKKLYVGLLRGQVLFPWSAWTVLRKRLACSRHHHTKLLVDHSNEPIGEAPAVLCGQWAAQLSSMRRLLGCARQSGHVLCCP